jgi:hypothetical protein
MALLTEGSGAGVVHAVRRDRHSLQPRASPDPVWARERHRSPMDSASLHLIGQGGHSGACAGNTALWPAGLARHQHVGQRGNVRRGTGQDASAFSARDHIPHTTYRRKLDSSLCTHDFFYINIYVLEYLEMSSNSETKYKPRGVLCVVSDTWCGDLVASVSRSLTSQRAGAWR